MGDPTAVYFRIPPASLTTSSTIDEELTGVTTLPFLFESSSFARSARLLSPLTNFPPSVMKTHRSASPSWAIPMDAPVFLVSDMRSARFSSVGSLGRPGNSPCALQFNVTVFICSLLRRRGAVSNAAPLAQSRHAVMPAPLIFSASTWESTASMYASPASLTRSMVPASSHLHVQTSVAYISSMSVSSSRLASVPSADMHLMPLNCGGLWEAVIITPPLTLSCVLT